MKLSYTDKKDVHTTGLKGLPEHYPVPKDEEDLLFFIQRNQNLNTVVYQLNRTLDGSINLSEPINVYWKEYSEQGGTKNINLLQRRLAYGYEFKVINNKTLQIHIVSYPDYKIYITVDEEGKATAISKMQGEWSQLTNIYVFAEDLGAFPNVKYVELYGDRQSDGLPSYERLKIAD